MSIHVDEGALLCALVIAPRTFSRNRFYSLFTQAGAKHARARAAELRTVVRHLAGLKAVRATFRGLSPGDSGFVVLTYAVAGIRLRRTAVLDALELALVRYALWRVAEDRAPPELLVTDEDRSAVLCALSKLDDKLGPYPEHGIEPRSD